MIRFAKIYPFYSCFAICGVFMGALLRSVKGDYKPDSVVEGHSSAPTVACWLKQLTRTRCGNSPVNDACSYLALLQVGFALPFSLLKKR